MKSSDSCESFVSSEFLFQELVEKISILREYASNAWKKFV